jgi:hypothetical protein
MPRLQRLVACRSFTDLASTDDPRHHPVPSHRPSSRCSVVRHWPRDPVSPTPLVMTMRAGRGTAPTQTTCTPWYSTIVPSSFPGWRVPRSLSHSRTIVRWPFTGARIVAAGIHGTSSPPHRSTHRRDATPVLVPHALSPPQYPSSRPRRPIMPRKKIKAREPDFDFMSPTKCNRIKQSLRPVSPDAVVARTGAPSPAAQKRPPRSS